MDFSKMLSILVGAVCLYALPVPVASAQGSRNNSVAAVEQTVPDVGIETKDVALVRAVVDKFDTALALRDINQLQAVGITSANANGWRRFFKSNPNAAVTDDCPANTLSIVSNDSANWTCAETVTIVSHGKPVPFSHVIHFVLTKTNGEWRISNRW